MRSESSQLTRLYDLRQHDEWLIIVLDACRHDALDQYLDRDVARVRSPALCSQEWGMACWSGDYRDVTYVSANPHFNPHPPGHAYDWAASEHIGTVVDCFSEMRDPGALALAALDHRAPKLVVHFMQPHAPYIGEEDPEAGDARWRYWRAYRETLDIAWERGVTPLLASFADRQVVVTADHGEALGEGGEWHHSPVIDRPETRYVPWVEYAPGEERPDAEEPEPSGMGDDETVTERLEALGYIDGGDT